MQDSFCLDDLYRMISHIYSEQNAQRPASATFAHFVEVCGILTMHSRKKKREGASFEDALCKALGWYFPLMAKFKVRSVEELIYRKYPFVCPYCRQVPHVDRVCKTVRGTKGTVDHEALRRKYEENSHKRPKGITEWQDMFAAIYPRQIDDSARSVVALFEELGELAEAVRVFERHPKYFAGEAADVFSYLMGLATEYSLQRDADEQKPFDLEGELLKRYPGICVQCGYQVCVCPLVPDSTVGRMAKELDIGDISSLFAADFEAMRQQSIDVSEKVLARLGGYAALSSAFPFDRGEANRSLILFCLDLADRVGNPEIATRLRSAALKAGSASTYAGSPKQQVVLDEILKPVQSVIDENKPQIADALGIASSSLPPTVSTLVINELIMGDKHISNSVIAQGPGSTAAGGNSLRMIGTPSPAMDLIELANLLAVLRDRIEHSPQTPEFRIALEEVNHAVVAANSGDETAVMSRLKSAGKVAYDLAVALGSGMLIELVKKANGM